MQTIHTLKEWQIFRNASPTQQSIGFVPTMGALHQGHLSLIEASQRENELTVVSIFVNPTQFNQADDFTHYPRTLEADLALLKQANVHACFVPKPEEIYHDNYQFQINETALSQLMEGRYRPGHFTGVLTVVMKLLQLVRPDRAYFGEKDYQQFQLIHQMASALFMNVEIKACPTIREASGLPFSSRNQRLTPEQRHLANQFAGIFHQPIIAIDDIRSKLQSLGITVDYIEEREKRRFIAVRIGEIRLLDNYTLALKDPVIFLGKS